MMEMQQLIRMLSSCDLWFFTSAHAGAQGPVNPSHSKREGQQLSIAAIFHHDVYRIFKCVWYITSRDGQQWSKTIIKLW